MQPKIKLKSSNLFITFSSRRGPLENRVNSRERERKNQKRKVKNSVFAAFSQTESVLNGVLRALCVCTCKVAKLRMNTLITGYTIMRASGNELLSFIFRYTLSRSRSFLGFTWRERASERKRSEERKCVNGI